MPRIFISYRRKDSDIYADRLGDALREKFPGRVFMDIRDINPGLPWRLVLDEALGNCAALLVVIGPGWVDAKDATGKRRLEDSRDTLRREVAEALRRGVRVFPLLVNGADMPYPEGLPDDLKDLVDLMGHDLTVKHWREDVAKLIGTLSLVPGLSHDPTVRAAPRRPMAADRTESLEAGDQLAIDETETAREDAARTDAEVGAKRKAEEDGQRRTAGQAQREAEAEALRKQEDRPMAAAEFERKAAEETRRKAEQEDRRSTPEELERKAAEEARRKGLAEAERKVAEEAQGEAKGRGKDEEARRMAAAESEQEDRQRKTEKDARSGAEEEAKRRAKDEAERRVVERAQREGVEEVRRKGEAEARRQQEEVRRRTAEEAQSRAEEKPRRDVAKEPACKTAPELRRSGQEGANHKIAELTSGTRAETVLDGRARQPGWWTPWKLVVLATAALLVLSFLIFKVLVPSASRPEAAPMAQAWPNQIDVAITAQGLYRVGRTPMHDGEPEMLATELKRAALGNPNPIVIIDADANSTLQMTINVMEAARLAGIAQTIFPGFPELKISLMRAEAHPTLNRSDQIRVAVTAQGRYVVGRTPMPGGMLATELKRAALGSQDPIVIIDADANSTFQMSMNVMEAARLARLTRVAFTVADR